MDSTTEPAVPQGGDVQIAAGPMGSTEPPITETRLGTARDEQRIRRSRKKGLARVLELTVRFVTTGSIHRKAGYLRPKL